MSVMDVLGPGCARCQEAFRVVRHGVGTEHLDCRVDEVDDAERMVELGVLRTPARVLYGALAAA